MRKIYLFILHLDIKLARIDLNLIVEFVILSFYPIPSYDAYHVQKNKKKSI